MSNPRHQDRSRLEEESFARGEPPEKTASILSIFEKDRIPFIAVFLFLTLILHLANYYMGKYQCAPYGIDYIGPIGTNSLFGAFTFIILLEVSRFVWKKLVNLKTQLQNRRNVRKYMEENQITIEDVQLAAQINKAKRNLRKHDKG